MKVDLPQLWNSLTDQYACFEDKRWCVVRLVEAAKNLERVELPLAAFPSGYKREWDLHELAAHFNKVQDADLTYPIILHPTGHVLDGTHRLIKAFALGHETILAVRFSYANLPIHDSKDDE